ncbi:hypothetical protein IJI94_01150 [Candidatus Saccharibacteria bacterium]|nr:hypothetical protein [Candidatus Saccharibacteria bacterium]
MESNENTQTPVASQVAPAADNKQKSSAGLIIALVIVSVIAAGGIGFGIYGMLQGLQKNQKILELQTQLSIALDSLGQVTDIDDVDDIEPVDDNSLISNTTWIASDGSEAVFTETEINWYKDAENHSDNYYSGTYEFYIGEDAIDYITQDLSEYGITKSELKTLFDKNPEYSKDNFVVFDIRYDEFIMDGEEQVVAKPLVPWYGFILDDNTYLDVANMNTGTYYKFTKSE